MNKTTLPPPPSIIAKILSDYSVRAVENAHDSLICDGDFVFGRHNDCYDPKIKLHLRRDSHQARIKTNVIFYFLKVFTKLRITVLDSLNDFDLIFEEIRKVAINISGVGPLLVYDTALRYAFHRGIYPNYVYICSSAGPLAGAKSFFEIIGKNKIKLSSGKYVDRDKLKVICKIDKSEFTYLNAYSCLHIENIMCNYHNELEEYAESLRKSTVKTTTHKTN